MLVVVAVGGNALLARGDKPDAGIQLAHIRGAAAGLVALANNHDVLICHGNGPQVGLLALESESDPSISRSYPLDVLGAQTQGMIGYWLAQSLRNAGARRPVVSVVTQTVVDAADPAFKAPTKFIGPSYTRSRAAELAILRGWRVAPDGDHWRRVVPSPRPQRVIEQDTVAGLLRARTVVICGGGGGAPVVEDDSGQLRGVEAVVDKDLTAALIAVAVHADRLLILTDVSAVMTDFGTPQAAPLRCVDLGDLARMHFPAGSMGPKIEACREFVTATGRPAAIGNLTDSLALLAGEVGTTITADHPGQPSSDDVQG